LDYRRFSAEGIDEFEWHTELKILAATFQQFYLRG
jgi:hypothetical protein